MNDPRDYKLDVSGLEASAGSDPATGRPFLSVHFACCNVYRRLYRNRQGTLYEGACPRCGRVARFAIGPHGTSRRSFVVE